MPSWEFRCGRSCVLYIPCVPLPLSPHILHVDDEEEDRLLFARAFAKSGLQGTLHSVGSAAEAMRYLGQAAPRPRLVVLDLSMPRFDGLDLLDLLRSHPSYRTIQVVILSGSQSHSDMQRCREMGIADYAVKPTTQQGLAELIATFSHWLTGSSTGLPTSTRP